MNNPKSTSGLGVASLVLGLLACLTCWIPVLGLVGAPLAVLGLAFGALGFLVALLGQRSGAGMPFAGLVVCAASLFVSIGGTGVLIKTVAESGPQERPPHTQVTAKAQEKAAIERPVPLESKEAAAEAANKPADLPSSQPTNLDPPFFGVTAATINDEWRKTFADRHMGSFDGPGVVVSSVMEGSPAQLAGIRRLDVIESVDGVQVSDGRSFDSVVDRLKVGSPFALVFYRWKVSGTRSTAAWVEKMATVRMDSPAVAVALIAPANIEKPFTGCPLSFVSAKLDFDILGTPTVGAPVRNVCSQGVVAFTVSIDCYNRFGEPVKGWNFGSNQVDGISQTTVAPGQTFGDGRYWTLYGHDNTTRVTITLVRIKLADGTEWTASDDDRPSITAESRK